MFKLDKNMQFINIDQNYLQELHKVCPEVYYKSTNYNNKPYIGILVNNDDKQYVIPLSSAKEKHKTWKNVNQECFLVYEYADEAKMGKKDIWVRETEGEKVKHILSMIDVKKMIPIKEGLYSVVNMNKQNSDTKEISQYKDLLNKEYAFCLKIMDDVTRKANKLYEKQMKTKKVAKFSCNFEVLEQVCDTYPLF